jgi:hypothetical protein
MTSSSPRLPLPPPEDTPIPLNGSAPLDSWLNYPLKDRAAFYATRCENCCKIRATYRAQHAMGTSRTMPLCWSCYMKEPSVKEHAELDMRAARASAKRASPSPSSSSAEKPTKRRAEVNVADPGYFVHWMVASDVAGCHTAGEIADKLEEEASRFRKMQEDGVQVMTDREGGNAFLVCTKDKAIAEKYGFWRESPSLPPVV